MAPDVDGATGIPGQTGPAVIGAVDGNAALLADPPDPPAPTSGNGWKASRRGRR